jgi:RimJ/RimL family protein N-acetyltransferase
MVAIQSAATGHVSLARLEPSDGEVLRRLFFRLSPETIFRRFLSPIVRPEQVRPERLLDIDHDDREAVVAVLDGEIVGVARYFRSAAPDTAELALVVADAWQRRGLATRMLASLGELALAAGIRRFAVTIQADNRPALSLLRRLGPATGTFSQGVYEATVSIGTPVSSR